VMIGFAYGAGPTTAHTWTDSGSDIGSELLDMQVSTSSAALRISLYATQEAGVTTLTNSAGVSSRGVIAFTWPTHSPLEMSGTPSSWVIAGGSFSFTPTTVGGHPTFTYSLNATAISNGFSVNSSTGEVTQASMSAGNYTGNILTVTDDNGDTDTTSWDTEVTTYPKYRYVGFEVISTPNGFIGCSRMAAFKDGSATDECLATNGGVAGANYAINGGFPASNIIDNNDSTFCTSNGSQAGTGKVLYVDMGERNEIKKMGYRTRGDGFGANERPTSLWLVAKDNSGDAFTRLKQYSSPGFTGAGEYIEFDTT
jgi:hypothetical protein